MDLVCHLSWYWIQAEIQLSLQSVFSLSTERGYLVSGAEVVLLLRLCAVDVRCEFEAEAVEQKISQDTFRITCYFHTVNHLILT